MPLDAEMIADAAVEAVTPFVKEQSARIAAQQKTIEALMARLDALEKREIPAVEVPDVSEFVTRSELSDAQRAEDALWHEMEERLAAIEIQEPAKDGKDADEEAIAAKVLASITQASGDEVEAIRAAALAMVDEAVKAIPVPKDGKDADVDAIRSEVLDGLREAADVQLKAMVADVRKDVLAAIPEPVKGEDGRDGVGLAGAMIDRGGNLVVTLTTGTAQSLGPVVGKDGNDGQPGLGFDDLAVEHDGHRTFSLVFARGAERKVYPFSLPVVLDCGVFKDGETYAAGDGVTWGGSYWIAKQETVQKPGDGDEWRLSVKRGRDGRLPEMDDFVERSLPKLTERLAPVVRKAVKDANGKPG